MLDEGRGEVEVLGATSRRLGLLEPVALGHKVAVREIQSGEAVVKFGVPIGRATAKIRPGQWVHLHNCASNFDSRSQTLDVHSGATTDTPYE
jgi:altronate dehydratase small subunit